MYMIKSLLNAYSLIEFNSTLIVLIFEIKSLIDRFTFMSDCKKLFNYITLKLEKDDNSISNAIYCYLGLDFPMTPLILLHVKS